MIIHKRGGKFMYYQNYEDYMRNILGYPTENLYTYDNCIQDGNYTMQNINELQDLYPECYKLINPIICSVCDNYRGTINSNSIESMVDEVYQKIIVNNEIMIKINIENRNSDSLSSSREVDNKNRNILNNNLKTNSIESRNNLEPENRQIRPNNQFLKDLIRILILNRLLGGFFPGRPPIRPPFPGPGRPPFPGGPGGMPPTRPPMPRIYEDFL